MADSRSFAKREYLEFAELHGGDEAKVAELDRYGNATGRYLFPDGAFLIRSNIASGETYSNSCWGYPDPSSMRPGTRQYMQVNRELLRNIHDYWTIRVGMAEDDFVAFKNTIQSRIHQNQPRSEQDLERLRELKAEVNKFRKKQKEIEKKIRENEPGYQTPHERRETERSLANIQHRQNVLSAELDAIRI